MLKLKVIKKLLFFFCCFAAYNGFAQYSPMPNSATPNYSDSTKHVFDSVRTPSSNTLNKNNVVYKLNNNFSIFHNPKRIDTTLWGVHNTDKAAAYGSNRFYARLGAVGRPLDPLVYTENFKVGFRFQQDPYATYSLTPENISFYQLRTPYTEISYTEGSFRERLFSVIHSQNISRTWNVGITYNLLQTDGAYQRQFSIDNIIGLHSNYFSKNGRYQMHFALISNSMKSEENGGIANPDDFLEDLEPQRNAMNVRLNNAQNNYGNMYVFIRNAYNFSRKGHENSKYNFLNTGALAYTFCYNSYWKRYTDSYLKSGDSAFYARFYFDPNETNEKYQFLEFNNTLEWTNKVYPVQPVILSAGVTHSYIHSVFTADKSSQNFQQLRPYGKLALDFKHFTAQAAYKTVLGDYNNQDYAMSGEAAYKFQIPNDSTQFCFVKLLVDKLQRSPDYIYNHYISNHYIWNNHFIQEQILRAGIVLQMPYLSLGGNYYQIKNGVYFSQGSPQQDNDNNEIMQAVVQIPMSLGKFHWNGSAFFNFTESNTVFIAPRFSTLQSLAYDILLFQKSLLVQPCIELIYNTAYNGNGYNPVLMTFYRQNSVEMADQMYLDLALNCLIKRARFFVKGSHLNALWDKPDYMYSPYYPMQDFVFYFGISWKFYD